MVDWISLAVPFAYLGILVGSMATFSSLYKSRKAAQSARLTPWFPPHLQRNIYLSLLHLEPPPSSPKVPDSLLKAALLRRATEDIHRMISIRSAKQAVSTLLARGSVGDELWQRFLRAEQEMKEELEDVVNEANALAPNWGTTIFQSANEIANNALLRKRYEEVQAQAKVDREWWDRKRAATQAEFMKELDEGTEKPSGATSSAVSRTPLAAAAAGAGGKGMEAKGGVGTGERGSDEDAVIVDAGGPTTGGGKGKKKKGKK